VSRQLAHVAEVLRRERATIFVARSRISPPRSQRRHHQRPGTYLPASHSRVVRLVPVAVAAVTLLVGLAGGTAYALFTASGSGTGEATVAKLQPVAVEPATATVSTVLFPGATGTLELSLTNPNTRTLKLIGVIQDGPVAVTGGGPGCTSGTATTPGTSGVSVVSSLATGLSDTLPPGHSTLTFPNGAQMNTSSSSTCQGASFHIPVAVKVRT
jgi:hypothetical protein